MSNIKTAKQVLLEHLGQEHLYSEIGINRLISAMEDYHSQFQQPKDDIEVEKLADYENELNELARVKDYWFNRCYCAEKFIEESPCDPDITKDQIEAHEIWQDAKQPLPSPPKI